MSDWPNQPDWSAGRTGPLQIGEDHFTLSVVPCGELKMPSGRLVACDPFAAMSLKDNFAVNVPPGKYPVVVTLADVSPKQDGSHFREAYASLILRTETETRRAVMMPDMPVDEPIELAEDEFIGFPVDAGTACFVDETSLAVGMPPEETWLSDLFENDDPRSWFNRMDDPNHIRPGIANISLPLATNGENLILFHSGWGDGRYPVIGGYNEWGDLVAVHIDFFVIPAE